MFTNRIRATLVGAAVGAGLIDDAGRADAHRQTEDGCARLRPRALPAPDISLDDLQSELRELANTRDEGAVHDGLGEVISGLDAQAPLVGTPFEITYIWLIVKLQALHSALENGADTDSVVTTVNTLATELADALGAQCRNSGT